MTRLYALPGKWADRAACAGLTVAFDDGNANRENAISVCMSCPVHNECAEWSMTTPDPCDGLIAGGLTTAQRRGLRESLDCILDTEGAS